MGWVYEQGTLDASIKLSKNNENVPFKNLLLKNIEFGDVQITAWQIRGFIKRTDG